MVADWSEPGDEEARPHFGPDDLPAGFTDEQAAALLGSTLIVRLTHVDAFGEEALQVEFHGLIEAIEPDGLGLRRADTGELQWLPPVPEEYEPAPPGHYRMRPGGDVVVDPDYLCAWIVNRPTD